MNIETLKTKLINAGYKVTKQREVIFEALLENMDSHLSPEELNEIVSKKRSGNWYSYGL